jgi:hypothetical protein
MLKHALLPNLLLVPFLIFLHWLILAIWFFYNYDDQGLSTRIIITLSVGFLVFFTYVLWCIRRFLIKAYSIIHYNMINIWLLPFSKTIADKVLNNDLLEELKLNDSSIIHEWRIYLLEKSQGLPSIIQRIIKMVLRKIGYTDDLAYKIKRIANKDTDEIANLMSDDISSRLIAGSHRVLPAQIRYLIPINIILIIVIWIIF